MVIEGFCSNCKNKTYFNSINNGKDIYKCSSCEAELKKCKNTKNNCLNMIKIDKISGYCDDCSNQGIKKARVGPIAVIVALGSFFWKHKDEVAKVAKGAVKFITRA